MVGALLALAACDGSPQPHHFCDLFCDGGVDSSEEDPLCNPVLQSGCQAGHKCTWIIDSTDPQYVGHVGCVPDGFANVGDACMFGAAGVTGYDDCKHGGLCSAYETPGTRGICKQLCELPGGDPCDSTHACVGYPKLFATGTTTPPFAGVCDPTCDPLADNDFDGPGSALGRSGSACGSATIGCYGLPSHGKVPVTAFTCMEERHYDLALRHRSECTAATGCVDSAGAIYVNSCNQGYLPLFRESTAVSTTICVAMCAPLDCYAGNCGSNDENRVGAAPHRCMQPDAVGSFGSGEECEYLWREEVDGSGHLLRSAYSDSVGACVDHAAYDLPSCKDLPLHGSGSALDAVDLGCVSTATAGSSAMRTLPAMPRTLYHRVMR
jgi:hypothetical protein